MKKYRKTTQILATAFSDSLVSHLSFDSYYWISSLSPSGMRCRFIGRFVGRSVGPLVGACINSLTITTPFCSMKHGNRFMKGLYCRRLSNSQAVLSPRHSQDPIMQAHNASWCKRDSPKSRSIVATEVTQNKQTGKAAERKVGSCRFRQWIRTGEIAFRYTISKAASNAVDLRTGIWSNPAEVKISKYYPESSRFIRI